MRSTGLGTPRDVTAVGLVDTCKKLEMEPSIRTQQCPELRGESRKGSASGTLDLRLCSAREINKFGRRGRDALDVGRCSSASVPL